jgi:hypothetical protein
MIKDVHVCMCVDMWVGWWAECWAERLIGNWINGYCDRQAMR